MSSTYVDILSFVFREFAVVAVQADQFLHKKMSQVFLHQHPPIEQDYYSHGIVDDGFCGFDPRAWIKFSRGSNNKGSEFEDRNSRGIDRNHVNLLYYEELR